jgi:hypothetical protein
VAAAAAAVRRGEERDIVRRKAENKMDISGDAKRRA